VGNSELSDAAHAKIADTTTVNLWIDALKVSLGSEHTHAVFKSMQEAFLAGTKDAFSVCVLNSGWSDLHATQLNTNLHCAPTHAQLSLKFWKMI
jgi:hypothetical protein